MGRELGQLRLLWKIGLSEYASQLVIDAKRWLSAEDTTVAVVIILRMDGDELLDYSMLGNGHAVFFTKSPPGSHKYSKIREVSVTVCDNS